MARYTADTKFSTNKKTPKSAESQKTPSENELESAILRISDLGVAKKSPSELELQISGDRVLYVLNKAIDKLKIAASLPRLLKNNACLLRQYMSLEEVEFIQAECLKHLCPQSETQYKKYTSTQHLSTIIDRISKHDTSMKQKSTDKSIAAVSELETLVDPHMAQVMEMLWKVRPLREKLLKYFNDVADVPCITLVNCIVNLKKAAESRLAVTAAQDRDHQQHLRRAWKANVETAKNIDKLHQQVRKQREDLGTQLGMKNKIVTDYMAKIHAVKDHFKEDILKKVHESEKGMNEDSQASTVRQADLSAEAKSTVNQYESLLSQHLAYEKGLRAKRFKVETQLSSWLAKYDADIGERQAEFEEITKGYEEEKAEMEALQDKFDEQEEEYVVLMAEKEEEEQRIWEERAYQFLINRSARKIQRYWRAYRQRKIERRKAKKAKAKAKKEKSAEGGGEPKPSTGKENKGAGKDKKGKGKGKGKGKDKQEPSAPTEFRGPDPMAMLQKKFGDHMEDLQEGDFPTDEVTVDLSANPAGVTDD